MAELPIRPFNVHIQSRRGTPLTVRAKLDLPDGIECGESGEALAASWYSCTRNIHLDNLEARARISLDFCRIVGA
jgi:hypothetical protein